MTHNSLIIRCLTTVGRLLCAVPEPLTTVNRSIRKRRHPYPGWFRLLAGTMSRAYKIALILKSRPSLPVYKDLTKLSDRELDEQVATMIGRMRRNESAVIARMVQRTPTFSLN